MDCRYDNIISVIISAITSPNTYPIVSGNNCGNVNLKNKLKPWGPPFNDAIKPVSNIFDENKSINVPTNNVN